MNNLILSYFLKDRDVECVCEKFGFSFPLFRPFPFPFRSSLLRFFRFYIINKCVCSILSKVSVFAVIL